MTDMRKSPSAILAATAASMKAKEMEAAEKTKADIEAKAKESIGRTSTKYDAYEGK